MVIEVVGNNNYLSVAQHAVRTLAIQTGIVVCKGVTLYERFGNHGRCIIWFIKPCLISDFMSQCLNEIRGRDSSVGKVLAGLMTEGCEFESRQERRENFSLQNKL